MIIFTGGHYIKCEEKPVDCLGRFYVTGVRWLKAKKEWSNKKFDCDFLGYEILTDDEAKAQGLVE